jgi:hypothetical protein
MESGVSCWWFPVRTVPGEGKVRMVKDDGHMQTLFKEAEIDTKLLSPILCVLRFDGRLK